MHSRMYFARVLEAGHRSGPAYLLVRNRNCYELPLIFYLFWNFHSDEINPAWFDTFLLIGYHPSSLGLFIDERRIKWIFDYRPGFPAFRIAADCELVCKNAGSVSTVVADYILRRSQASSRMTDDVKLALSLLYGR